jgi:hypothetical protein
LKKKKVNKSPATLLSCNTKFLPITLWLSLPLLQPIIIDS